MKNNKDIEILERIIKYCNEIDEANQQFGNSLEVLRTNSVYKNSVAMCILQIGELANTLSAEFIIKHKEIPWKSIISMRNRVAHGYENFDVDVLWNTLKTDIPTLKESCNKILISEQTINYS